MRSSTILLEHPAFRIDSEWWKYIISKHSFWLSTVTFPLSKKWGPVISFCDKTHHTTTKRNLCGALYSCWARSEPVSDSCPCSISPMVKTFTNQKKLVFRTRNYFPTHYDIIEQIRSPSFLSSSFVLDAFIACTSRASTLLSEISILSYAEFLFQVLHFSGTKWGLQKTLFLV